MAVAWTQRLRQYSYFCTSFCVSICTFVLAASVSICTFDTLSMAVAWTRGLRQYLCICTSSCVSICTFVLANLDTRERIQELKGARMPHLKLFAHEALSY